MTDSCQVDLSKYIEVPHCSTAPEPRDICQPLLQEHHEDSVQPYDEDYEEDDDDEEEYDEEEEEEEQGDSGGEGDDSCGESGNKKRSRRSEARKIRKLANLFAMVRSVQSINMQQNVKSRKRKRGVNEPVVCDYCPESFVCFASLNTHSKKEHGMNLLQCTECGK